MAGATRESQIPLTWEDGEWTTPDEAGRREEDGGNVKPLLCVLGVLLAFLIGGAALIMVGVLWSDLNAHEAHQNIDSICNRGDNSGTNLEGCVNTPAVDGYPLVSANAGAPEDVLVSRLSAGVGTGITEHDEGYLEVFARLESLSPGLVLGVSPAPERAITIDVDLPAVNLTPCNITCEQNFFLHLPNALAGYGFALGTDHVFADDATHPGSAILGGYANAIVAAQGAVIVGGRYNNITGTFCSLVGGGRNNTITSPRAAIVIGQYNTVAAGQSIIGAGQNNSIVSTLLANAILAGEENSIDEGERSVIGAGYQCVISDSSDSGIYSGKSNQILASVSSFVGAGTDNVVDGAVSSGIVVGRSNNVSGTYYGFVGGGEDNLLVDGQNVVVGAGVNNSISQSYHAGVLAGELNSVANSNRTVIGAGLGNSVSDSTLSAVLAGEDNVVSLAAQAFIGAGLENTVAGDTLVQYSGVVAGSNNTITGDVLGALVGAGEDNVIQRPTGAGALRFAVVLAGADNVIATTLFGITTSEYSIVGAGDGNVVTDASFVGIVAGLSNVISNVSNSLIGAGRENAIANTNASLSSRNAIVTGFQNAITGYVQHAVIGSGSGNSIRQNAGAAGMGTSGIVAGENNVIEANAGGLFAVAWAAIGSGTGNTVRDSQGVMIGAGIGNAVTNSTYSFVGAGNANLITPSAGTLNSAIVAGISNSITGNLTSRNTFIGCGENNTVQTYVGANDGYHNRAIIAGTNNAIRTSGAQGNIAIGNSTIIGVGVNNLIFGCWRCGIIAGRTNSAMNATHILIGAGQDNSVIGGTNPLATSSCPIVAGASNLINGNLANGFIGAGSANSILSSTGSPQTIAIVAGGSNTVRSVTGVSDYSIIGAGNSNLIDSSSYSALVAGRLNVVGNSSAGFVGAGTSNIINATSGTMSQNAIISGTGNLILGTGGGFGTSIIGAGQTNKIERQAGATSGVGQCAIVAGVSNTIDSVAGGINTVNYVFIGAGQVNLVRATTRSAIVSGDTNTIANASGAFIGAGLSNEMSGLTSMARNAIVAGNNNSIYGGGVVDSFMGSGQNNVIELKAGGIGVASQQAIVAGATNIIESLANGIGTQSSVNFIGAGTLNKMQSTTRTGIVAGESNLIANVTQCFIGAGISNEISGPTTILNRDAIVAGNNNSIYGAGVNDIFIGCGSNNVVERKVTATGSVTISGILAGTGNIIESIVGGINLVSNSIIGAGSNNLLRNSQGFIGTGSANQMVEATRGFIGAGNSNKIIATVAGQSDSAVICGGNNSILGLVGGSFIGCGQNNIIERKVASTRQLVYQFIGTGIGNIIEATDAGGTGNQNFIGAGSNCTVRDSTNSAIATGTTNTIITSTGAFIATGNVNSITSANYASILSGAGIVVSGSLNVNTAIAQHSRVLQTFETPGMTTIVAGTTTVALGHHIFIANAATATLALGNSGTIPDGMQIRIRDIGNLSTNPVTLSCVTAATCIICPPNAACTAAGGTVALNTQYLSQLYTFRASTQQWIGMSA